MTIIDHCQLRMRRGLICLALSEQGLKEVGGDGTPSTGADGNVPPR
jgi:hypothetical protein